MGISYSLDGSHKGSLYRRKTEHNKVYQERRGILSTLPKLSALPGGWHYCLLRVGYSENSGQLLYYWNHPYNPRAYESTINLMLSLVRVVEQMSTTKLSESLTPVEWNLTGRITTRTSSVRLTSGTCSTMTINSCSPVVQVACTRTYGCTI